MPSGKGDKIAQRLGVNTVSLVCQLPPTSPQKKQLIKTLGEALTQSEIADTFQVSRKTVARSFALHVEENLLFSLVSRPRSLKMKADGTNMQALQHQQIAQEHQDLEANGQDEEQQRVIAAQLQLQQRQVLEQQQRQALEQRRQVLEQQRQALERQQREAIEQQQQHVLQMQQRAAAAVGRAGAEQILLQGSVPLLSGDDVAETEVGAEERDGEDEDEDEDEDEEETSSTGNHHSAEDL